MTSDDGFESFALLTEVAAIPQGSIRFLWRIYFEGQVVGCYSSKVLVPEPLKSTVSHYLPIMDMKV